MKWDKFIGSLDVLRRAVASKRATYIQPLDAKNLSDLIDLLMSDLERKDEIITQLRGKGAT